MMKRWSLYPEINWKKWNQCPKEITLDKYRSAGVYSASLLITRIAKTLHARN